MKKSRLKTFGYLVMLLMVCLIGILPTNSVKAANIKNKSFIIHSDHTLDITIYAVKDTDVNATDVRDYWPVGGKIEVSGYNTSTHSYTVTMTDTDVTSWTPYITIRATSGSSYYPKSITTIRDGGDTGMNKGTHEVHNLQDISGKPNYRRMYIGLGYSADEIKVDFGKYEWYATYDLNGGTGDNATQSALRGDNITTHKAPTRHGYSFKNYTYSYNGSHTVGASAALSAGSWDVSNITGPTIKLTAQWDAIPYTISYNGNKPSKASGSVTGSTASTGLVYNQTGNLASNGFKLTGWHFVNWNTRADGKGTTYQQGQQIKNMNDGQNTTLYAQWEPNVYGLYLDDQYATEAGTDVIYEKYDYGWYAENEAKTSVSKVTVPKKTGYSFNGYYTQKDGGGGAVRR